MKIVRSYKVELRPNSGDLRKLIQGIGTARFVYNFALELEKMLGCSIARFNDRSKHPAVLRLFDKTIARLEAEHG